MPRPLALKSGLWQVSLVEFVSTGKRALRAHPFLHSGPSSIIG
jgi:hypothetical protein